MTDYSQPLDITALKKAFIGLDTHYPLANGQNQRRIYLDSGASTLMFAPALDTTRAYLAHYANTHTSVHTSARLTTRCMRWAVKTVLDFVNADPTTYNCTFIGSGATAALNRVAAGLATARPTKGTVLISSMEHHSNDLPHRRHARQVEFLPLTGTGANQGAIDLAGTEALLKKHQGDVNYLAITGISNVTGILNPLRKLAALAHRFDAYLVVDGAQMAAHAPVDISGDDIDVFVFSGHKVYAPGSPGVLVARNKLLETMPPYDLGGGMVAAVTKSGFDVAPTLHDREQAGTPNIPGCLTLACALKTLANIDMQQVYQQEQALLTFATHALQACKTLRIYGDTTHPHRAGSITFNLDNIGHGLTAAILNDYHGIAVRNECFCAHPYVQSMLMDEFLALHTEELDNEALTQLLESRRGMVRASFGLYTSQEDIEALAIALKDIEDNIDTYRQSYDALTDGSYQHKHFQAPADLFNIEEELTSRLPHKGAT